MVKQVGTNPVQYANIVNITGVSNISGGFTTTKNPLSMKQRWAPAADGLNGTR